VCASDSHIAGQLHTPPDRVVGEVASRQHGVVARRQLIDLGFTRDAVDGSLARGVLLPIERLLA